MQVWIASTVTNVSDIVYKESNEGGVILGLGLALPAGPTFRGSYTAVKALVNGTSLSGLKMLPKVECPDHKALLQYLSSY